MKESLYFRNYLNKIDQHRIQKRLWKDEAKQDLWRFVDRN